MGAFDKLKQQALDKANYAAGNADQWAGSKTSTEDVLFQRAWKAMSGKASQLGMTEQQAWEAYNKAGRPRGSDSNHWIQDVTAPGNAVTTGEGGNATITPDAGMVNEVRQQAGLGSTAADGVATLDTGKRDVDAALAQLRGDKQGIVDAGERGRGELTASLEAAKTAGNQELAGQQDLIAQLQAQARGEGPSAAMALYKLALGRNISAQAGAAAGVRGGNAAAAARNAGIQGEGMMRESTGAATALRAQEQQQAQGLLSSTLAQSREGSRAQAATVADIAAQIRGQDIGTATAAAGSQAQIAGLTQAAAALEESKKNAAVGTALSLLQLDTGVQQNNVQTMLAKAGLLNQSNLGYGNINLGYDQLKQQKEQADRAFAAQLVGTAFSGLGSLGSAGVFGGGRIPNTAANPAAGGSNGLQGDTYVPASNPASDAYWGI